MARSRSWTLRRSRPGRKRSESFAASVGDRQASRGVGLHARVWYAEHHNMASIASSATSVLIAYVGAHTSTIRLGAGGVMLPNHPPLVIAEQFGALEAMFPGRIDLGLGRAPGSDQNTQLALRRDRSRRRVVSAGRPRAAGVPHRGEPGRPACRPCRGRARTCRFTSLDPRCSARSSPLRSVCLTRSPRTFRPPRCESRSPPTARVQAVCAARRAICHRRRQRHRRRLSGGRAGAAAGDPSASARPAC